MTPVSVWPQDAYNQTLIERVHPPNWINPTPQTRYDLVVIGAGTAGLVVAAGAAGLGIGLKIALIEKHLFGGDCLNFGCVPSKTLIRSARAIAEVLQAQTLGIEVKNIQVNFAQVMERLRKIRSEISHQDSVQRFQALGIDVFLGTAHFLEPSKIAVNDQVLTYRKAVIATGARASYPPIPGLDKTEFFTNETIFSLTELPARLAVIGGGPIGCELAQAFQRLGSQVTLFHRHASLLNRETCAAAELLQTQFSKEGIKLILKSQINSVEQTTQGKVLHYQTDSLSDTITVDALLVCTGRSPNIEGLNLEKVGVKGNPQKGIIVNDYLQTTNPHIYAAGDVCLTEKFTHAADASARIVIKNSLFSPWGWGKAKVINLILPRVTYTDPEIAQVGLTLEQAQSQNPSVQEIRIPLTAVDRGITDGATAGFIQIVYPMGADRILGATIVAKNAGEMLSTITLAMTQKLGLNALAQMIYPYPTQAEMIKKAADTYRKTLLTTQIRKILQLLNQFSG